MSVQPPRRPSSAEITMARQQGKNYYSLASEDSVAANKSSTSDSIDSAGEILAAISSLREELLEGGVKVSAAEVPEAAVAVAAPVQDPLSENEELKDQLSELSDFTLGSRKMASSRLVSAIASESSDS